jgi:hypothetical protein
VFTEPLSSNDREVTYTDTQTDERDFEVRCLDGLMCHDIQAFKFNGWGIHTHIHRQKADLISLFLFSQNMESK